MADEADARQSPPAAPGDELDAKFSGYGGGSSSSTGGGGGGGTSSDKEVGEFTFTYNMNYRKRGMFVIINNKTFEKRTQMNERTGTDVDAANLYQKFKELGFDVHIFHNCKCKDMLNIITEAAKQDHHSSDCFGCAILSHGDEGVVYGTDGILQVESLIAPFKGDKCLALAGKPKLFIIQACRGNLLDHGVDMCDALSETDQRTRIPIEADFLFAYSTTPGYYSWRNSSKGSWFVQALCKVLEKWGGEKEMVWMLTHTNYLVSYDYESNAAKEFMNRKKQIPSITSQLTKELYFRPKT